MNAERLRRVEEIYHAAREREAAERAAFLASICGADSDLRSEVESLLASEGENGILNRRPAAWAELRVRYASGERVGPYEIERLLGEGGMGAVYRARDTRLGRTVAIKTAHTGFSGRSQREARAIASLNHPHICTLYDIGQDYLVMEFLEGETLADRLSKGPMPQELVLKFGGEIADALWAAHSRGILHRDLKPQNLIITKRGIKVLDFGLAKFVEGEDPAASRPDSVTSPQALLGTPAYMAPEQLEGKPCDARTDIFALGLALYEMATGRRAFNAGSRAALISEILRSEPPVKEIASPALAHVVERCLAKEPENRWQTARDIKLELDYLSRAPSPSTLPDRKLRRRWLVVAPAALVVAVAVSMVALRQQRLPPEEVLTPLTSYPGNCDEPLALPGWQPALVCMERGER